MSDANKTQVGGNHYAQQDKPQHWDLSIMYGWDPFQYQVTKYVMRWKDKHPTPEKKLEDLKKARHFLDKYIENYARFLPQVQPMPEPAFADMLFLSPGGAEADDNAYWQMEGMYGDGTQLYTCRKCKSTTRGAHAPGHPHACP